MYTASVKSIAASFLRDPLGEILLMVTGILVTLCVVSPALAQDGTANVRMVHLSPDAPNVMVELDGQPVDALADVGYGDASPYLPIPAGPHEIAVFATADATEPVLEVEVAPEAGSSYTIAGIGLLADETFGATLFEDDDTPPEDGKTEVRVIHAIPDVGAATVSVEDGPELFALPGFGNASDYAEVDPGTYTLDVTPAGADAPAFSVEDISVAPDSTYTAFAVGQASEGTVGTIITDDSDNGRIVAVTGNAPNNTGVGVETLSETGGSLDSSLPSATSRSSDPLPAVTPTQEPTRQTEVAPATRSDDTGPAETAPVSEKTSLPEAAAPVTVAPEPAPAAAPVATAPVAAAPVATAPVAAVPVAAAPVTAAPVATAPVPNVAPIVTHTQAVEAYVPTPVPVQSVVQDITSNVYASVSQSVPAVTSGGAVIQDVSISQAGVNVSVPSVDVSVPNVNVSTPSVDVQGAVSGVVQGAPVNTAPVATQPVVPVATPVSTPAPQQVVSTVAPVGVQDVSPVEIPVQPVQAVVNVQATVINSGARRRFVYGR